MIDDKKATHLSVAITTSNIGIITGKVCCECLLYRSHDLFLNVQHQLEKLQLFWVEYKLNFCSTTEESFLSKRPLSHSSILHMYDREKVRQR
jgi:hypothetical protein